MWNPPRQCGPKACGGSPTAAYSGARDCRKPGKDSTGYFVVRRSGSWSRSRRRCGLWPVCSSRVACSLSISRRCTCGSLTIRAAAAIHTCCPCPRCCRPCPMGVRLVRRRNSGWDVSCTRLDRHLAARSRFARAVVDVPSAADPGRLRGVAENPGVDRSTAPWTDAGHPRPADRRGAGVGGPVFVEMGALEGLDRVEGVSGDRS